MKSIFKKVFVCSEFQGLEVNLEKARKFCEYVTKRNYAVFAPHLLYPQYLNDSSPEDRAMGLESGCSWLSVSDEMWVFVCNGRLSEGMKLEIGRALIYKVKIRYFDYDGSKITEMCHINSDTIPKSQELTMPSPFAKNASKSLGRVAKALSKGVKYEHLQGEIDALLGPLESEKNESLDAEWEEQYRSDKD